MRKRTLFFVAFALVLVAAGVYGQGALGPAPTTLEDFFLPGSQPGQSSTIETSDKCDNCHGGYNNAIEPAFIWRGSMMAHALRDPLLFAALAVAEQDAPGSGDLCIRCHTPKGWVEGRSTPTDGSALQAIDRESVGCDACHRMVRPSRLAVNPYPGDAAYTAGTYPRDQAYLATLDSIPRFFGNGMFVLDSDKAKRGPFADANATHQMFYSPFHRSSELCGTCHDVSNPAFDRVGAHEYVPNAFATRTVNTDPHGMVPIERTYSEWTMSAYNTPQGVYAPQFGGNKTNVSTCQDCHMRDVSGVACNKTGAVFRNDLPLHDLTGGNTFMPRLVAAQHGSEIDPAALNAGVVRARYMLQHAATLATSWQTTGNGYEIDVRVTNETGHKLPSGYPEGRRMWLRVRAYAGNDALVYESGAYDTTTAVLTHDPDLVLYEIEPGISYRLAPILGAAAGPTFHMVLNDTVYRDSRIPPRGFSNAAFMLIQSPPVGHAYADGQYWDDSDFEVPITAVRAEVELLYQTTSREFVEFLRNENHTNSAGQTMYDLWAANGKSMPEVMASATVTLPGSVGVDPSLRRSLTLEIAGPHPARGEIDVQFACAPGSPATLELLDVQGRLVERRSVGALGPGAHRIAFAQGARLAPGTYVVRLAQGGASVTRKVVLTR